MKDGHLNKCKVCTKLDVSNNRFNNLKKYQAYDRDRGSRQKKGYLKEYRERYPNKYKAQCVLNNALRDGKIKKKNNCEKIMFKDFKKARTCLEKAV